MCVNHSRNNVECSLENLESVIQIKVFCVNKLLERFDVDVSRAREENVWGVSFVDVKDI